MALDGRGEILRPATTQPRLPVPPGAPAEGHLVFMADRIDEAHHRPAPRPEGIPEDIAELIRKVVFETELRS